MLIETTTPFNNSEDAQDSLYGLKDVPGFVLGYVTVSEKDAQEFHVVTIFQCNHVTKELPRQQRHIIEVRTNPAGILGTPVVAYSSIRTEAFDSTALPTS